MIIDELDYDRDALRAMALTSSKLVDRSRTHLHHHIRVPFKSPRAVTRLEAAFMGFMPYIRIFNLEYHQKNAHCIRSARRIMHNLRHLEVVVLNLNMYEYDPELFRDFFPRDGNIRTLHLFDITFKTFHDFAHLLAHFPQLRELHMYNVTGTFSSDESVACVTEDPPSLLEAIYADEHYFADIMSDWFAFCSTEVRITRLKIFYPVTLDGAPLFRLMRKLSPTLTHLDLNLFPSGSRLTSSSDDIAVMHASFNGPLLAHMSNLQSLTFGRIPLCYPASETPSEFSPPEWILNILKYVDTSSLRQINFNCSISRLEDIKSFPFNEVLSILSARSFPLLNAISFSINDRRMFYTDLVADVTRIIYKRLPELASRNLLQVDISAEFTWAEASLHSLMLRRVMARLDRSP